MTAFAEYQEHDATGLAELIRAQEVTADEVMEAALAVIDAANPEINAVVHRLDDQARAAAADQHRTGAFAGVPFLVKDLTAVAGAPLNSGSRSMRGVVADHDAEIVARHRAAGLIIVGKTNTPEFGLAPTTEPELHGPTRNPWNQAFTAGGSSGGAAAAVAAGMVPVAHASDGGGSIRIPASACGLFGLKPTRARNPQGPDRGEGWFGLSQQHAVSRTVRDSARLLDATQGPDLGAPYVAPAPERAYAEEVGADPGRLRIAFTTRALLSGGEVHPDCAAAVRDAAALCEELGHEVIETAPVIDIGRLLPAMVAMVSAGASMAVTETALLARKPPRAEDYELVTWIMHLVATKTGADQLARAIEATRQAGRVLATFLTDLDVLLTSTLGEPPWEIGALGPSPVERRVLDAVRRAPAKRLIDYVVARMGRELLQPIPNTPVFNMTGQPAMSVPLHWNDAGLPIGVQFAGRYGDEATLFRLAAQLEEARPWRDRRPG